MALDFDAIRRLARRRSFRWHADPGVVIVLLDTDARNPMQPKLPQRRAVALLLGGMLSLVAGRAGGTPAGGPAGSAADHERIARLHDQAELAGEVVKRPRTEYANGVATYVDVLTARVSEQRLHRDLPAAS